MKNEELVRMFNPKLKMREVILLFLIVMINGLKCIVSDIGLDTSASWILLLDMARKGGVLSGEALD